MQFLSLIKCVYQVFENSLLCMVKHISKMFTFLSFAQFFCHIFVLYDLILLIFGIFRLVFCISSVPDYITFKGTESGFKWLAIQIGACLIYNGTIKTLI